MQDLFPTQKAAADRTRNQYENYRIRKNLVPDPARTPTGTFYAFIIRFIVLLVVIVYFFFIIFLVFVIFIFLIITIKKVSRIYSNADGSLGQKSKQSALAITVPLQMSPSSAICHTFHQ